MEGGEREGVSECCKALAVLGSSRCPPVASVMSTAALPALPTTTPRSEAAGGRLRTASKLSSPSRMVSLNVGMVTEATLDPRSNTALYFPPL